MTKSFILAAIASGLALLAPCTARAEVWEFDREGREIIFPRHQYTATDNDTYDKNAFLKAISTRGTNGLAAVYRPMAEGVSVLFAEDPVVLAAGLDPEEFTRLFVALIDQESRFNPRAVSPKGARGLGQLMPETALALGVADAFEPMDNLRGAARYLVAQLGAFKRADLALAAYNAGPERVTQYGGIPPFRETRDYVSRITRAADLAPPPVEPASVEPAPEASASQPQRGTVLEWQN